MLHRQPCEDVPPEVVGPTHEGHAVLRRHPLPRASRTPKGLPAGVGSPESGPRRVQTDTVAQASGSGQARGAPRSRVRPSLGGGPLDEVVSGGHRRGPTESRPGIQWQSGDLLTDSVYLRRVSAPGPPVASRGSGTGGKRNEGSFEE